MRHSTSGSVYDCRLRLMTYGLEFNEIATNKCPYEAHISGSEVF